MKRVGGCFEPLMQRDLLLEATMRASAGKHDRSEVRLFLENLNLELRRLAGELQHEELQLGPYRPLDIVDGKPRRIHVPPFRDRVVHQAMAMVLGPVLARSALPTSMAGRKGRGHRLALVLAQQQTRNHAWFLKGDVRTFYARISHQHIRQQLVRRFRERRVLRLLDTLLASFSSTPGHGLPMGSLMSQLLANAHLDPVDHLLAKHRFRARMRYLDDFFLWHAEPHMLHRARGLLEGSLQNLGLELKHGGILNRTALGVPCLGFTVYPGTMRLDRAGKTRLNARLKYLHRQFRHGDIDEQELQARGTALMAWVRQAPGMAWRAALCQRLDSKIIYDVLKQGERQELSPHAWRQRQEHGSELPLSLPQQEAGG